MYTHANELHIKPEDLKSDDAFKAVLAELAKRNEQGKPVIEIVTAMRLEIPTDKMLVLAEGLRHVKVLNLDRSSVAVPRDPDTNLPLKVEPPNSTLFLKALADSALELKALVVSNFPVFNSGMKEISRISSLEALDAQHCGVTETGIKNRLSNLPALKSLDLSFNAIGHEGIQEVGRLKELKSLSLKEIGIPNIGIAQPEVTQADLIALTALVKLQALELGHPRSAAHPLVDKEKIAIEPEKINGWEYRTMIELQKPLRNKPANIFYEASREFAHAPDNLKNGTPKKGMPIARIPLPKDAWAEQTDIPNGHGFGQRS